MPEINTNGDLKPQAQAGVDQITANVHGIHLVGGTRPSAKDPTGHPSGLAADLMVDNAGAGDDVLAYVRAHWDQLGVKYVIWQRRYIAGPADSGSLMPDAHDPTQNHMNHDHVQFNP